MASLGSLLGGLQSAKNPGVNMTAGLRPYRPSRVGVPQLHTGAWTGRPGTAMAGVIGGVRTTAMAAPPTDPSRTTGATQFTGGHPPAPTNTLGRLAPVTPPGGVAGALAPPPGASLLQFDQWLASQPLWVQQQASDVAARNSLLSGYGFYNDPAGHLVADPHAAQDSVIAQEDLRRQRGIGHTAQMGANHGNLFSGASLLGVQNADDAYRTGAAKALQDLTGKMGDITQRELDTKISMSPGYNDYVGATQTADPSVALQGFKANKNSANVVAGIDAYLKAYAKYLTPSQAAAFAAERARQVGLYQGPATTPPKPTAPPKTIKSRKRRRPPGGTGGTRAGGGLYAGNQGGGSAARGA